MTASDEGCLVRLNEDLRSPMINKTVDKIVRLLVTNFLMEQSLDYLWPSAEDDNDAEDQAQYQKREEMVPSVIIALYVIAAIPTPKDLGIEWITEEEHMILRQAYKIETEKPIEERVVDIGAIDEYIGYIWYMIVISRDRNDNKPIEKFLEGLNGLPSGKPALGVMYPLHKENLEQVGINYRSQLERFLDE
ncbi:hypothetical protein AnigIFM50267_010402 [Aspergillus niger]|nr:hypothetical protein AnigIFM50267_010402 [Aspergillus niger]